MTSLPKGNANDAIRLRKRRLTFVYLIFYLHRFQGSKTRSVKCFPYSCYGDFNFFTYYLSSHDFVRVHFDFPYFGFSPISFL